MVEHITDTEIYSRIKETLVRVNGSEADHVTPATRLQEDLDIDSIRLVDVVLALEDEFAVQIEDDLIGKLKTLEDVANVIKLKTGDSGSN